MGEQAAMLQHVEQAMREVRVILSQKLDSFWDFKTFVIKSLLDHLLRKVLNVKLCYAGLEFRKIFASSWFFND